MADSPIDETVLDHLRYLQKKGKPDFPSMIVGLFLDTTPAVLKELETAVLASDTAVLRTASHKLISATAIIGATGLWALLKDLETVLRTGAVLDTTERVRAITEEYKRVEAALRIWCVDRMDKCEAASR